MSLTVALSLIGGLDVGPGAPGAAAAAVPTANATADGLALWYKLDAASGAIAADSSGHGRDGTVIGAAGWKAGEGLTFNGTDTYVKVPDNLLRGMSTVTVAMDVLIDPAQVNPYFLYGFGNSSGGNGNGYLFTTGNDYRSTVATGNWSTEQNTRISPARNLPRGVWKHIAFTLGGNTGVLYQDGVEVGRNPAVTITPGAIGAGTTTANYLGRSLYAGDRLFAGKIRDFRVYDRALAGNEIAELAVPVTAQIVQRDKSALTLGDVRAVEADLALPMSGPNGSTITWASSDSAVIGADGRVTRPPLGRPDARVTLTATLVHGSTVDTKSFEVTVLAQLDDSQLANRAADALTVRNVEDVRGNLTLPTTGRNGTTVTWKSDRPTVISTTGIVNRPQPGAGTTTVVLIATVTKNQASASRTFTAKVRELPAPQAYVGYAFSYFTGEGTANGEQIYSALSRGNDPLHWRELNGGNPTLTSTMGEKGLRDPFIIRSPEGDKFYQIATDLRIHGNGNWDGAQRTGSKSIMVWESTDLVNWTDQRLVQVSPDTAGNTWAPEAYYDKGLGAYVVFWASKLYASTDPDHAGNTYNKMLYATTRDFVTFSEPKIWVDPGYSVIDSTMIEHAGTYYRFTKDERNNGSSTPCSKFIIEQKADSILDLDYDFVADCIGKGSISQGEGPTIFKSNTEEKWYLFIDEFGGRGYIPFESTDLAAGKWTPSTNYALPARPRHGTVLPVTRAEYDRMLRTYAPDQLVTSVADVPVATLTGTAPTLPATVTATFADGHSGSTPVTWESVPPSAYATPGTFTVRGTLLDGAGVTAKAVVTVWSGSIPVTGLSVQPSALSLGVGVRRPLSVVITPPNATDRTITWSSSKTAVATVSGTGVIQTVKAGKTTITARSASGKRATVELTVSKDIPPDLLVRYEFEETGGAVARDSSGLGNDGSYQRTPAFGTGVHGGSFKAAGGASSSTTAPYVAIPGGVLDGVDNVTVSTHVKWNASTTVNQWVFGLGASDQKYLFATPRNGGNVLFSAITTGSWQAEKQLVTGTTLPAGSWQHLAVVLDSTAKTAVLYLNGQAVARATGVTVKASDLVDATKNYTGYIGKSFYGPDPYFGGEVDDFRIYGRALGAAEILELAGNTTGIAGVTLPELKVDAIIDDAGSRIVLPLKEGTKLTALKPTFTLAGGARINPASSAARDLSKPVTYTVTGSDKAKRVWTVEAMVMRSPVLPGLYADPNIAVFNDRFYLYPTTDGFEGWSGTQFKAFSSTDLVHWQDHGVILDLGPDVNWAEKRAWAPTIAERGGKYYFYFSAEAQLGVAVADSPTGPFKDALGKPLVPAGQFPGQMIDPAVFTDDDGQSYLYFGNGGAYVVKLNEDMISFDAAQVRTITPPGYREGSFVFKRDGKYYFTWSENDTRDENYRVAYATGASPYGPWTKQGVILQKRLELGIKGPGHHSVVQVPGTDEWYVAYHRFAIPGGDGMHRETTVDRLTFDPDGAIEPVVPTLTSIDPVTIVRAGADTTAKEGTAIALAGTVSGGAKAKWSTDPGAPCAFADRTAVRTTFTCADNGTFTVRLTAGGRSDTAVVTVTNVAPVVTGVYGPLAPVAVRGPVELSGYFVDQGTRDTYTCTVDWKDGTTSAGTVGKRAPCTAKHAYRAAGVYSPVLTITDDDGGTASRPLESVVVYDPKAGSVTGSGWLDSPAGAYRDQPAVTGRASFTVASRYAAGASVPTGVTEFRLQAGALDFRSAAQGWLVVSSGQARYKGSGKINGSGTYGFELTAIDGPAGDQVHLRIWDKASGRTVYDNGTSTAVVAGGITLHRP